MERHDTENLFRRHKGKLVNIKGLTGELYRGFVVEVTNDYVSLGQNELDDKPRTFVLFDAIEFVGIGDPA